MKSASLFVFSLPQVIRLVVMYIRSPSSGPTSVMNSAALAMHRDEMYATLDGVMAYLWKAADCEGKLPESERDVVLKKRSSDHRTAKRGSHVLRPRYWI